MKYAGVLGIVLFCILGFIFSSDKKSIDWKIILWGIIMQFIIAAIILGDNLVSLISLLLWIWAVAYYNIDVLFFKRRNVSIFTAIFLSLLITGFFIFIISLAGKYSNYIMIFFWYSFIVIGVVKTALKSFGKSMTMPKYWANVFGFFISVSLFGSLWANGQTGAELFQNIGDAITNFLKFASLGGEFIFGNLYSGAVGWLFIIDVGVATIFFIAFVGLLESLGIMNEVIVIVARFIDWNMKGLSIKPLSGAETLVAISSIPMGGDNLLLVKNYLGSLTKSEISLSVSAIMATISASLFAAFVSFGISATHLLAASAMSVPAVIAVSKLVFPETKNPVTRGQNIDVINDENYGKPMNAIMDSIINALQTVFIMAGSLIVFISLIGALDGMLESLDKFVDGELLNGIHSSEGEYKGIVPGSLQTLLGYIFSPIALSMGTPWEDVLKMGYLMGTKISINEFVAFSYLGNFIKDNSITQKTITIASFALCGYANPGTVAMMLGKVLPFSGNNRENYLKLGFKCMLIGAAASWMTASIAGVII